MSFLSVFFSILLAFSKESEFRFSSRGDARWDAVFLTSSQLYCLLRAASKFEIAAVLRGRGANGSAYPSLSCASAGRFC